MTAAFHVFFVSTELRYDILSPKAHASDLTKTPAPYAKISFDIIS